MALGKEISIGHVNDDVQSFCPFQELFVSFNQDRLNKRYHLLCHAILAPFVKGNFSSSISVINGSYNFINRNLLIFDSVYESKHRRVIRLDLRNSIMSQSFPLLPLCCREKITIFRVMRQFY